MTDDYLTPKELIYCSEMIAKDEGFRSYPYKDSKGIWTVGYGINLNQFPEVLEAIKEKGISQETAFSWLIDHLKYNCKELMNTLPWTAKLEPGQRIGLANMCYNLGMNKLLEFQNFIKALRSNDMEVALIELLNSKWAQEVGNRADRISALIDSKGNAYESFKFN